MRLGSGGSRGPRAARRAGAFSGPGAIYRVDFRRGQGHRRGGPARRVGHGQERRVGRGPGGPHRRRGPLPGHRAAGRHLHRHRGADRIQDRRGQDRSSGARAAGHHPAHARNRQPRGNGQRAQQLRVDQHRNGDGRRDAELRSADAHADADPQRAERRRVPARRQHHRHQPRLDDQRPAGRLPQHHARRREQQRQLPAQHRRVLRLGHAAPGRGRSGVGHARRGRRAGRRRRRRRDDGVPDAVGRQPLHGQRLRVLPEPESSTRTTTSTR